jgi:outer membrane protein assembly factor BamB
MTTDLPQAIEDTKSVPVESKHPLRLWPAWLILALQLVALILTVTPSIRNLPRFIFMMAGPLVSGLALTIWLLFASRLRWREKLALVIAGIVTPLAASQISEFDDALRTTMWIYGVPLAELMITLALSIWSQAPRRCLLAIVLLGLGWSSFSLVRNEGFDGDYYAEFRWRWSPRHEDTLPELTPQSGVTPETSENTDAPVNDLLWSQYRGPEGNGASDEEIAPLDWTTKPPKELWRISIGPGWGSFAYNNQKLFTQEQRGEKEHVTCYSAADGRAIWTHADETRFNEVVSGAGPRSTPSVANGYVYALGGTGLLTCLNELDGTVVWQKNLVSDFGAPIPMWGFSGSPLILEDKLIIFAGGPGKNGLLALECASGNTLWGFPSTDMNYTTARPMTLCDQSVVVFCDSKGAHGIDPKDGSAVWTFKPELWKGPAMVDPQQIGPESLIVGLGDGVGTARLEVSKTDDQWTVTEAWSSTKLRPSFNDSVVFDNSVYGFNQAIFSCIDAATGERKWQGGRYGFGQAMLLKKAGQILVAAENGDLVLLKATSEKLTELSRLPMLNDKTWNHPIVAGKHLFLRNGKTAVCLQLVE